MSKKATMTLNLTDAEMGALEKLSAAKDMSKTAVMRQTLRLYQLIDQRLASGERMFFSGDKERQIEFIGL